MSKKVPWWLTTMVVPAILIVAMFLGFIAMWSGIFDSEPEFNESSRTTSVQLCFEHVTGFNTNVDLSQMLIERESSDGTVQNLTMHLHRTSVGGKWFCGDLKLKDRMAHALSISRVCNPAFNRAWARFYEGESPDYREDTGNKEVPCMNTSCEWMIGVSSHAPADISIKPHPDSFPPLAQRPVHVPWSKKR